jgi:hypothetical protein
MTGLLFALGAAALGLAGAEVLARRRVPRKEGMPRGLFSPHPELGYVLTPGFSGRSSLGIEYRINGQGLRDRDRSGLAAGGRPRVLALGNSYAMGAGEEFAQTFLALLEERLWQLAGPCEVVKAGIGGYGTRHELAYYREFGRQYRPGIVLVLFALATDFRNNLAQKRGEVRRGRLVPAYRQNPLKVLLEGHSSLYVALMRASRRGRLGAWLARRGLVKTAYPQQVSMLRREYGEAQQLALDQTLSALEGFAQTTRAEGCQLVLCAVPDRLQVEPAYLRSFLAGLRLSPREVDLEKPNRILAEFCVAQGAAFIDLLPLFRTLAARGESPYRQGDIHWNLAGRQAAAEEVAARLLPLCAALAAPAQEG